MFFREVKQLDGVQVVLNHRLSMSAYITSVSVENAWAGKITQSLDLLGVEDARKALFIATLSSKDQVDRNVRNIPMSSQLFDFKPENLVSVLYGVNGSGKTTVMQLADGLFSLLKPLLDQQKSQRKRRASAADISDWNSGVIPKHFQDKNNAHHIKFLAFGENSLIKCINSSMFRWHDPPYSKPSDSIAWRSNFRFEMEGVCATPYLWHHKPKDELNKITLDSKFKIELLPIDGEMCLDVNGIVRENKKVIENFEGAFFALRIVVNSFDKHLQTCVGEHHDGPVMGFEYTDDETIQHTMEFEVPIMIHPEGGVLIMGRTVMDFSTPRPPGDERFSGIEEIVNEADEIHLPILHHLFYRELLINPELFDDEIGIAFFTDITEGETSQDERNCKFSRQMIYELFSEGMAHDFFLSFDYMPSYRGGRGSMSLPSLLESPHFEQWEKSLETNLEISFETSIDHCDAQDFIDLATSLSSEYIWPTDYTLNKLKIPSKMGGRFSDLNVSEKPAAFMHATYILNPPDTAFDGIPGFLQSHTVSNNIENMFDAFVKLNSLIPEYTHNSATFGNWIGSFLFGESPVSTQPRTRFHSFDWLMNKYSEAYSSKGFNEEQAKTAAQVEIKHLIKNGLEQIWFQELEHNVVANRFELMNKLLEKYLNICILDPEKGFDPNRLFYRKKTAKPDLFPHLRKPNISVDQLSSGMRNLFNLIMALGNTDSKGPLFIDEPEISLHMDWEYGLKDIATLLADSTKRQIIFSTHSPDLIMNFGERSIAFISESEHDGI